jgi:hypothetical protein
VDAPDKPGWWWFRGKVKRHISKRWCKTDRPINVVRSLDKKLGVWMDRDSYELSEFDGKWWPIEPPAEN